MWWAGGLEWLEVVMPVSRREVRGGAAFAAPLLGVVLLLATYWLLADWPNVPAMLSSALAAVHWPP
jgi:hypothetical protein